jgi:imidazolonepropionase
MTTAIVNIAQLVTLSGSARPRTGAELSDLAIINDAALLIEDGRITAAGPYNEIKSKGLPRAVVDANQRCVTPGFVDAHTHLVFAGNRAAEFEQRIAGATYQQIAAAGGGILRRPPPSRLDASLRHHNH